jgi:RNA polymerase sigma-70 factor (ECF subfamily)
MPISTQTDTELFQALRSGNREALGILYDRYGVLVYRLALRVLSSKQDAEDLTQDIFINLSRTTAFDAKRGNMKTFLMVMTRSRAIDRIRKLRSQSASLQKWQQSIAQPVLEHPMENASKHETSEQVRAALQGLRRAQSIRNCSRIRDSPWHHQILGKAGTYFSKKSFKAKVLTKKF